jgi:hypothetical protein
MNIHCAKFVTIKKILENFSCSAKGEGSLQHGGQLYFIFDKK